MRVIIIEDSPDDAALIIRELEHTGYAVEAQRVQTAEELQDALAHGTWNLVLADHSLPRFSAPEGLAMMLQTGLDVPFIVVSGSIGEEMAVQLMRDGAADYVMKDHLSRLGPAVQRELHDADERKRKRDVEQALANSEKRYRLLVENQTDLLVNTDPQGRLLFASPSYCDLVGRSLQELTTSSYQPLIHPDDLASVADVTASLSSPPYSCRSEARTMTVGGWRWIEWNSHAKLDSHGSVVALIGSGRDITERKDMEESLARVKTLLGETEKTGSIGGWAFDAQKLTQEWTEETFRILEIDVAEGEPQVPRGVEYIAPTYRPMAEQGIQRAIEFGEPFDQDWEIITAKGNRKWVRAVARAHQEQGRTTSVSGSFQDITERKQAEEAERESELRYRTFIDVTSDLVFLKDESFRYIISNKANNAFLGRSETDVIGFTDFDLMPNNAAIACRSSDQEALAKGINVIGEETVDSKTYQTIKFPVPLSEGHVGVGGYVRDITDRKRAEEDTAALQVQLAQSQKLEAIGQLAGGVAHDFNNLLTGILGNVAIIQGDLPASNPLVANLLAVETAARQAADLAKGLLTFSRRAVVAAVPLDVAEAVGTTLTMLRQSLPATMNIVRDVEQPAWSVLADRSQIAQVILNLAVNARDAMQGKGTLTIRLRNEQVGEEYVRTHPFARIGEFVHLGVSDTGPGISPEVREHLFEPFYTTKPAGSGTGLGLSIVYGAVKQADGWVTADSPPGAGTIFDIFLPRCLEKPIAQGAPVHVSAQVCSGTVLVVEDEPVVCAVAQSLLARSGYTVLTAGDGASALRVLQEHQGSVDLILLDMTMPGMTTQEIIPALRAFSPSVPILLTSGYTSGDIVQRMLD
ncbi:MAG: PAS domain S-box protein, partial [Caldiserica bacterium]|nr:PAS domain S-box protein [Caldisericota bacterium]